MSTARPLFRSPGKQETRKTMLELLRFSHPGAYIFLLFLAIFLPPQQGFSQGFNERIYASYIQGDMDSWFGTMEEMEGLVQVTKSVDLLYDLAIAQYGYIAFCISEGKEKEARIFVKKAEENLDILEKEHPDKGRILALRGAVYGYKVGLDPYKAVFFGRKAIMANRMAMEISPGDPQVWMEKGNIELYKPEIFQPDSKEAARIYNKAIRLFESDSLGLRNNWLYLNTLSSLATAYATSGMIDKAGSTYLKILSIEPEITWIRNEVYPDFKRKYGIR